MKFTFSKFSIQDFPAYQSWFSDKTLDAELGPMDHDWLEAVLQQENGCQYSIFSQDELIAVIGVIFPDAGHPSYYITDFAVRPDNRNQGIGSKILTELLEQKELQSVLSWKAFVKKDNDSAKRFFTKNGWYLISEIPDEHGMLEFEILRTKDKDDLS